MKKPYKILTIVVIFALFTLPVAAKGSADDYISDFGEILPEGFEGFSEPEKLCELVGLDALISLLYSAVTDNGGAILSLLLLLLGATALSYLASLVAGELSESVGAAVALLFSLLVFSAVYPVFSSAMRTVGELSDFFSLAVPIMTSITLAGGGAATSSVQAVGMNFTLSIVTSLASRAFLPLSSLAFTLGLTSSLGDGSTAALSRGVRSAVSWLIGAVTALLVGTLSLQTVVASAADSAAMRAAKYAASGIIPVVGGTVSGALSTLVAGLSYAKGIIGGGAIAAMLVTSLSPLLVMLLYRLVLSVGASFADTLGASPLSRSLSAFRFAADTVIAVFSLSVVTYIFEIILFLFGGVNS